MNDLQKRRSGIAWPATMAAMLFVASASQLQAQLNNADDDDDGIINGIEDQQGTLYLRSESPYVMRALDFTGGDCVVADPGGRYAVSNWTAEAWVYPTNGVTGFVPLISRRAGAPLGVDTTIEIGLVLINGETRAYTRLNREGGPGPGVEDPFTLVGGPVPLNSWTHLAATFASSTPIKAGLFILYINGFEAVRGQNQYIRPVTPLVGTLYLGSAGFEGRMMEVRVWESAREPIEIYNNFRRLLLFSTEARENSFEGSFGTYLGRPTVTRENGFVFKGADPTFNTTVPFTRHTFAIEAYIKMEPGSAGGIIARRKVDLGGLVLADDDQPISPDNEVVGDDDPAGPWAVTESLEITGDGNLQAQWWGNVTYFPVARGDRLARRFLKSEVDLRDGEWHHVAVSGNGINITLYIDGYADSQNLTYFKVVHPPAATVTSYAQYDDVGTVLRIGQGGFDGVIDEVMFWNDWMTQAEIIQHGTYGLTLGEVATQINYYNFPGGVVPFNPLPLPPIAPAGTIILATGPGSGLVRHNRLVSYTVLDGTPQQATFVDDLANPAVQFRILPLPTGLEIVSVGRPPIAVDGLARTFSAAMPGYFPSSDGGITVENYMLRNFAPGAGVFSAGAAFFDLDMTDPAATEFLITDSDNDGMPDWWESANGTDSTAPDADIDLDGDGLTNLEEYQAGTHPYDSDSDGDGVTDDAEDPDGDGLTNIQEQDVTHTHSRLYDTDDDGFSDGEEVVMGTDPLDAYSPLRPGAYEFNGAGRLRLQSERIGRASLTDPETVTDLSRSWTVEAWVRPASGAENGIIVRRLAQYSGSAPNWLRYELGLTNGVPYIRYHSAVTTLVEAIAAPDRALGTNWTHVAGVLDLDGSQLRLYVDGVREAYTTAQPVPQILYDTAFETTIGGGDMAGGVVSDGFSGGIDAVRMWNYVRSGYEIQQARGVLLPEFAGTTSDANRAPKRIFNFDDCSTGPTTNSLHAQNSYYESDWMNGWLHAANVEGAPGGAVWVPAPFPPLNLDSDDDETTDVDERTQDSNLLRSESPFLHRYVHFADGVGDANMLVLDEQVDAVETGIYALPEWTVETWVRPTVVKTGGRVSLIQRTSKSQPWVTFELGVTNAAGQIRPYVLFDRDDAAHSRVMLTGSSAEFNLRTGTNAAAWNHLAATYADNRFSLYIDGNQVAISVVIGVGPAIGGGGQVVIGAPGFEGDLREVRIWKAPRTAAEITDAYRKTLLFSPALLENIYNANNNAYLGRSTLPEENGYVYDRSEVAEFGGLPYQSGLMTHKFALEAWVKMDPGAAGGIVAERKIDVNLLPDVPDWRINHSLRVTADGQPQAVWQGQISVVTPMYVPPANLVLARLNVNQEIITRNLTSEVDIRDGMWHHLALVGDSATITLYIDGIRDTEKNYYTFMARAAPTFESFFFTYPPSNSVLRVADDGIQARIDEVLFWNEDLTQDTVIEHMNYGLNSRDITQGLLNIAPVPAFAQGSGHHQRLVSYLTFDGDIVPPWINDDANEVLPYRMLPLPTGDEIIVNTRPPITVDRLRGYSGRLAGYFAGVDGGTSVENYMQRDDWGYAGMLQSGVSFNESATAGAPAFANVDIDGDDLPEWWEVEYGLDPGLATGMDGAYGDPDGDGLPNIGEFQAGTSPIEPDTDQDGFNDFFSWDDTLPIEYRIFGERFTDHDGMDDGWEAQLGLNPREYDSHLDSDADGWLNGAEFAASVDQATATVDYRYDPQSNTNYPRPVMTFSFAYDGFRNTGPLRVSAYHSATMDGIPNAVHDFVDLPVSNPRVVTNIVWDTGYVREGKTWFFAYYDNDGDGVWTPGEPAGLAQRQPLNVRWATVNPVEFILAESQPNYAQPDYELPGYGRFTWLEVPEANNYRVLIRNVSLPGAPVVIDRTVAAPRTYFHEGDYLYASKWGLPQAGYQWFVYHTQNEVNYLVDSNRFVVTYPATLVKPVLAVPNGTILTFARNDLKWQSVTGATWYDVNVATDAAFLNRVASKSQVPVYPDSDGLVSLRLPVLAGDSGFANGTYYWQVRAANPQIIGPWSTTQTFGVDVTDHPSGPYSIAGDVYYFGKVTNGNFVVQAFSDRGFALTPDAQATVQNTTNTNDWPQNHMAFTLRGLRAGTYYVRGFLDQDGNKQLDAWESVGFVQQSAYAPKGLIVPSSITGVRLPIILADTDNDRIADDWEFQYTGNTTTMGAGTHNGWTAYLLDTLGINLGINDFEAYAATPLNTNPTDPNAALWDGVPLRIKAGLGLDPLSPLVFYISGASLDGSGRVVVQWHALSGTVVDVGPGGLATESNGGVELGYRMQYSADLNAWADVPGGGTVTYNATTGTFEFVDPNGLDNEGYYRYRVYWSD